MDCVLADVWCRYLSRARIGPETDTVELVMAGWLAGRLLSVWLAGMYYVVSDIVLQQEAHI